MTILQIINAALVVSIKYLFLLATILGPAIFFGLLDKPQEMFLSILGGCMIFVLGNIHKFSYFKIAGMEAKLKEAKEAVKEAEVTIAQMRELLEPFASVCLYQLTYGNRMSDSRRKIDKEQMVAKISDLAKRIKIYDKLEPDIKRFVCFSGLDLYRVLSRLSPSPLQNTLNKLVNFDNCMSTPFPTEAEIRDLFTKSHLHMDANVEQALQRYLEYLKDYPELSAQGT